MKKKMYIIVAGLFLLAIQVKAQPNAINYQGAARNAAGATLPYQLLGLEFTIHQGSASGTIVYQETDTATTNQFGLFTVKIGMGVVKSGTFSGIGWGANSEFLDVEMDPTGGTSYVDMGTQQLLSVPYALYAGSAGGNYWTANGNAIYSNNSGSVGIGTAAPTATAALSVIGGARTGSITSGIGIGSSSFASGKGYYNTNVGDFLGSFSFVTGVDGEVSGPTGSNFVKENIGVLGVATNPDDSDVNWGVLGYAANSNANNDIGVGAWAQTNGTVLYTYGLFAYVNPDGGTSAIGDLAGEFIGDLDVEGTLSKSAGTFKIDDPLDPANKYLYHSFVESPDMMNVYNGNITTDANGDATVTLPQYFQAENKDFKYQLTVIGQFAQAIIATKVNNNQFTVKTDKPNVEVSWQVTGVRNDPYANEHRVVAEVEKKGAEKGHYIFPQYYGQPKSMSIASLMAPSKSIASLSRKTNIVVPKPQPPTAGGNASLSTAH